MRHGARLVPFLNAKFQGLSVALRTASGERDDAGAVREVLRHTSRASPARC